MKQTFLFIFLSLCFFACNSPNNTTKSTSANPALVAKHEARYKAIQQRVAQYEFDLNRLFEHLPAQQKEPMIESISIIQKYDLNALFGEKRVKEGELTQLMGNIEQFLNKLELARQFVPEEKHRKTYDELHAKIIENKDDIESLIRTAKTKNTPNDMASALFFQKLLDYNNIDDFLANSVVTKEEFENEVGEMNEQWAVILPNILVNTILEKAMHDVEQMKK